MQDDLRMQNKGYQNVRNPDGSLQRTMDPVAVNALKAWSISSGVSPGLLTPQQRELQTAGNIMRGSFAQADRDYSRNQNLQNLAYQEEIENFQLAKEARDNQRKWMSDMWANTKDNVGGKYGVKGLR